MNETLIKEFEDLLRFDGRAGMERLINYLRKSDFYTAPASTRYHSCHEGGLLEHSMNVYKCLKELKENNSYWKNALSEVGGNSIIVSALLHDICKTSFYVTEYRNKKVYSESGSKRDAGGRFDWEAVQSYTVDDKFPYGHGEKSVMMISEFIQLSPMEKYAIRWHMGFTEPKENWNTITAAIKKYPLVLALHESDLQATYLLEEEE